MGVFASWLLRAATGVLRRLFRVAKNFKNTSLYRHVRQGLNSGVDLFERLVDKAITEFDYWFRVIHEPGTIGGAPTSIGQAQQRIQILNSKKNVGSQQQRRGVQSEIDGLKDYVRNQRYGRSAANREVNAPTQAERNDAAEEIAELVDQQRFETADAEARRSSERLGTDYKQLVEREIRATRAIRTGRLSKGVKVKIRRSGPGPEGRKKSQGAGKAGRAAAPVGKAVPTARRRGGRGAVGKGTGSTYIIAVHLPRKRGKSRSKDAAFGLVQYGFIVNALQNRRGTRGFIDRAKIVLARKLKTENQRIQNLHAEVAIKLS